MQAERGYQIARQTDHIIDQIEITRNILHICLRLYSPFDSRVETVRARLESLLQDDIGDTVDMQVWNTFATFYAYRGDAVQLRKMIDMAWPHTQNNKEYHIYTLANLCLADILEGKPTEAVMHYMEAREKALDGGNILAVRQINDDITYLNKHFCSADSETVFSQIQQFVDEIEKIVEEQMKEAS